MGKVIAIASQKGGVGKTTTTVNIAASLATLRQRTLVIDLDEQNAVGFGLGLSRQQMESGIYDVFLGRKKLRDIIHSTPLPTLKVIPYGKGTLTDEFERFVRQKGSAPLLRKYVDAVRKSCDFVLIDCPPGMGDLTIYALSACDSVLVPMQPEPLSLKTLTQILKIIRKVRRNVNPDLIMEGLLLTMYDENYRISREVAKQVWATFPEEVVFRNVIPRCEEFSSAFAIGRPIIMQDPNAEVAQAYLRLTQEIIKKAKMEAGKAEAASADTA
ncbi:MAG: ParA family protein [Deltaproteobacteria bacterium]|nr:ParA family protein [bacterium]MCB9477957.1 ParA family protein [Deltaproteobacteria bacterium]MCB9478718.1 ParA family protein [Deltaproteobacteria bacterium]MCB9488234.1 ParA family protein [Deltaproteobacteria bacterium]